jgi:hypothetical protein
MSTETVSDLPSEDNGKPSEPSSQLERPTEESQNPWNEPNSAVRIGVQCVSHTIPGAPGQRRKTLGDIICRNRWGRDMDEETDVVQVIGFPQVDGEKVRFILDSGVAGPDAKLEDIPVLAYKWDGTKLYVSSSYFWKLLIAAGWTSGYPLGLEAFLLKIFHLSISQRRANPGM